MSFEEAYKEYLIYAESRHKKQGFDNLQYAFNSRIFPYFKDCDLYSLSKNSFLDWQKSIYNLDFSNSYYHNLFYIFCGFLDFCVSFLNFPCNYLREIGQFKEKFEVSKTDFYTISEFNLFIKYVDNEVYKQFFNLLFFTGLRSGEAMALQFKDLHDNCISVTKTITNHKRRIFDTPKSKSSYRDVKIDKKLFNDLLKLKDLYCNCNNDYFIFGGKKPLAPTTINRYKKKACEKANLRSITLHQFRHSHASMLVNSGIPITEVSKRLGHKNSSITLDVYSHSDLLQEKRVLKTLNSVRFNFFDNLQYVFKNFISLLKHFW